MHSTYDQYYQTENLFGEPYPELIRFLTQNPHRGSVLDLGCGQGRDSLALARLGYRVTGIDSSKLGIEQMLDVAQLENLSVNGIVSDIYSFDGFGTFDIILLDSMFHFAKKDKVREIALIKKIISGMHSGAILVVCIMGRGQKVKILNETIDSEGRLERLTDEKFTYTFHDQESGHQSMTDYRMIAVKK